MKENGGQNERKLKIVAEHKGFLCTLLSVFWNRV